MECGFAGKASSEDFGRPGSVRDTMHAKVLVVDDAAFVGSFNLSRSGEANAENVLEIEDAPTADRLAAWVDELARALPAGVRGARRRRRGAVSDPGRLDLRTLDEGGQRAEEVGGDIAAWIARGPAHAGPRAVRRAHPRPGRRRGRRRAARRPRPRGSRADRGPRPGGPARAADEHAAPDAPRPARRDRRRRAADRRPRRPHAPQVRGARRRGAVVRVDELDARLVDA